MGGEDSLGPQCFAVVVVAAVAVERAGRCHPRSRLPRIVGRASTSGISWVLSWRWPPVTVTASGMPPVSVITWCFVPGRTRSSAGDRPGCRLRRGGRGGSNGSTRRHSASGTHPRSRRAPCGNRPTITTGHADHSEASCKPVRSLRVGQWHGPLRWPERACAHIAASVRRACLISPVVWCVPAFAAGSARLILRTPRGASWCPPHSLRNGAPFPALPSTRLCSTQVQSGTGTAIRCRRGRALAEELRLWGQRHPCGGSRAEMPVC